MHMVLIVNQPRFKLQNTLGGIFQELSYSDHLKRGLREYANVCLSETVFDPCARQVNDSNSVSLPITAMSAVLQCAEFSR